MRIKMFTGTLSYIYGIESSINSWLELNKDIEVIEYEQKVVDNNVLITMFYYSKIETRKIKLKKINNI